MSDRFRPSRAGVINIWDYADEEFVFADGRLVLRGHNGSGKTKALEVLFPFVLDGVADARRLDPFSGENRTMKSNLLYRGQEAEYGYVWMEFARPGQAVTLIIGIRAHKHRDGVRTSFFVTGKRVGVDFGLLDAESRPFTEKQLKAVLGPDAHRETATEYRDAVDATLFGLGRERYTQLLDLLLALRRPLLAKDLDPGKVSATLTSGLSPVDEQLVDLAARDFENLAAVQKQFDDFATAHDAVRGFLDDYAHYLRTHARARLDRVRAETAGAVEHARTVAGATTELDRATRAHAEASEARDAAESRRSALERRLATLKKDETYQAQGEIELQRRHVTRTGEELARERERLARSGEHLDELSREAGALAERLEHTRQTITRDATDLAGAAERAGIVHDGDGPVDTGADLPDSARARATARREDIAQVRAHLARVDEAVRERARAEQARDGAAASTERREREGHEADTALAAARRDTRAALETWATHWTPTLLTSTTPPEPDAGGAGELLAAVDALGEPRAPTLVEVFTELTEDHRTRTARAAERLSGQVAAMDAEVERLERERAEVAAERDDAPPADPRRTADREGRPGAPLWRLVRFAGDVASDEAAGLEGALHAAGLLTAWVHPDPDLTRAALAAAEPDGYLLPAGPCEGRTLADVLVPEEQALVPAAHIDAILRGIDLDGTVTPAARFDFGFHAGAHPKPAPEFIGATNRAHRRAARLAGYDERIAKTRQERDTLRDESDRTSELLALFGRARTELPPADTVLNAVKAVTHAATLLAGSRADLAERGRACDAAAAEADTRRRALQQAAAERSMPVAAADVDAVARAVDDFDTLARALHTARGQAATLEEDLTVRQASLARRRAEHGEETEAFQAKEREHLADVEELTAREAALDAPFKELLAQVAETERQLAGARAEHDGHRRTAAREHDARIRAEADLEHGRASLTEAFGRLFEHAAAFAPFAHADLRPLLGATATTPWPADAAWPDPAEAAAHLTTPRATGTADEVATGTAAGARPPADPADGAGRPDADPEALVRGALPPEVVELLDAFGADLDDVRATGESALKSAASQMSTALRTFQDALDACTEDYRLDHDPAGVVMVYVSDEGGRNPVATFARRMAERVEEQGVLLEERERTVLEDELLTGLAQQIHDRVRTARELVKGMNADTRSRPMSSGTRIGIRWVRSDDLGDRQLSVARLLDRGLPAGDGDGDGPSGLAGLRGLLREMIRDYRAAHPRATYRQALSATLDYRTWYRFELMLVVPGEKDVKLTKAKHEQMSGGEKSAAIHLPLFAAANALYASALPTCPHMIALDEAFAGIDDRYKPELLGLTVKFGLDLFMTGHDLWVHYDTVPMAAHYDMHHDKSAHAVSAMLMLWDGGQTVDADAGFSGNEELAESLLGFTPTRRAPAATEGTLLEALET